MAYMSFEEFSAPHQDAQPALMPQETTATFSPLEWAVIALARRDGLHTLHHPSRLTQAMATVFGGSATNRLADDHLEALRRAAVILWHAPDMLTPVELDAFEEAGFTPGHLDLIGDSVRAATRH